MAKRKKSMKERRERAEENAARNEIVTRIADMMEVLMCPVLVASEHADYCADRLYDIERRLELTSLARDMHAGSTELQQKLESVLADLTKLLIRQADEIAAIRDRLLPLEDHEVEHAHLDPNDIDPNDVGDALFGPPEDGDDEQPAG